MLKDVFRRIGDLLNAAETHKLEGGEFDPVPGSGIVWKGTFGDEGVAFFPVNPDDPSFEGTLFALDLARGTVRELGRAGRLHTQPKEGTIVVTKI